MVEYNAFETEEVPRIAGVQNVTALVCTRNRGSSIVETIKSILANTHPCFELVVVDQSTDETTAEAIAPFQADPRVRYIRSNTTGKSRSLNLGIRAARSKIVMVTDDDCVVPPDWLEKMSAVFEEYPRAIVAFCNVTAPPHDFLAGTIPVYVRSDTKLLENIRDQCAANGIGAGSALRRDPVLAIGGFDEKLGPGGTFASGEDFDLSARALLMGYSVLETDRVAVVHYGFRNYVEFRDLTRRDWIGIGAGASKILKGGRWDFLIVPMHRVLVMAVGWPLRDLLRFKRPHGLGRVGWFLYGFILGWRTAIDKETLCFRTAE
ncbi:MAG: glycosyl transferase family protein [Chthonomonadaceae bacterium]|nr:glycosyl transferase family protein [Chthonomonadaceae bacterium]